MPSNPAANPTTPLQTGEATTNEVVIIGAGLAGLYTALKLAPAKVLVIAAKSLGSGASSLWAQGGIAAAIGEGDTPEAHTRDTIKAGGGLVDPEVAELVTADAKERIYDLLNYGVPFDKDLEGKLALAREAAHRANRIVHVEGDRAGSAIMSILIETVKNTPSIRILEGVEVHRLEATGNTKTAAHLWPSRAKGFGPGFRLKADHIVLATGGAGHLYALTTNPEMARGEGLAMAARIGAGIMDAEFVQFHPTAIDIGKDPAPLATEALRGEGAQLINKDGTRFMPAYHKDAELGPRDTVARAVYRERQAGRGAFLDCTGPMAERIEAHYPTVLKHCRYAGIDPATTPIPVAPAAHFHMGGVKTDLDGQTSVKNLWACGEVAATGLHGANRLASNSLLEVLVFGNRIALAVKTLLKSQQQEAQQKAAPALTTQLIEQHNKASPQPLSAPLNTLRNLMFSNVGLERNKADLTAALEQMEKLEPALIASERAANMLLTARFITRAALQRTASCGSHHRSDAIEPEERPAHSSLTINDITAKLNNEPAL